MFGAENSSIIFTKIPPSWTEENALRATKYYFTVIHININIFSQLLIFNWKDKKRIRWFAPFFLVKGDLLLWFSNLSPRAGTDMAPNNIQPACSRSWHLILFFFWKNKILLRRKRAQAYIWLTKKKPDFCILVSYLYRIMIHEGFISPHIFLLAEMHKLSAFLYLV